MLLPFLPHAATGEVVGTGLDTLLYNWCGADINNVLRQYDFFAVFEVKNGDPRNYKGAPKQAKDARDFVAAHFDAPVFPGIAYVHNREAYKEKLPDGIEVLIHVSQYDDRRLREAVEGVLEFGRLPDDEKGYIHQILRLSENKGIPLAPFFDKSHPRYGKQIVELLPWCRSRSELAEKLGYTRGLLMELYIALLFDEQLDEGDVCVRVPCNDGQGDIDVLVATTAKAFDRALQSFPRGVNKRLSRQLRR